MNFSNKFDIIQKGVKKALAKRPEWRSIEVVITSATRNRVARKGTWVRIPPSPPHFGRHFNLPYFFVISSSIVLPDETVIANVRQKSIQMYGNNLYRRF